MRRGTHLPIARQTHDGPVAALACSDTPDATACAVLLFNPGMPRRVALVDRPDLHKAQHDHGLPAAGQSPNGQSGLPYADEVRDAVGARLGADLGGWHRPMP